MKSLFGIFGTRMSRRGTAGWITCSFGGGFAAVPVGGAVCASTGAAGAIAAAAREAAIRRFRMIRVDAQKKKAMPAVTALYSALSMSETKAV